MKEENTLKDIQVSEAKIIRDSTREELSVTINKDVPITSYQLPDGQLITGDNLSLNYQYQTSIGQIKERLNLLYSQRDNVNKEIDTLESNLIQIEKAVDEKITNSIKEGTSFDGRSSIIQESPISAEEKKN